MADFDVDPTLFVAVSEYIGKGDAGPTITQILGRLPVLVAFVKAHTRGAGFDSDGNPVNELRAVIVSACARSLAKPDAVQNETTGPFSVQYEPTTKGFTLPELAVLNRYRRRAA